MDCWHGDALLGRAYEAVGEPPHWSRPPGFVTLVRIILEQGVSLTSARILWQRLLELNASCDPQWLAQADLRTLGISERKCQCLRKLALAQSAHKLDLESLADQDDESVMASLCQWNGIGPWTAQVYMLLALQREDIFPASDMSVQEAYRQLSGSPRRPRTQKMEEVARAWKGQRSQATRLLWFYYLKQQGINPSLIH